MAELFGEDALVRHGIQVFERVDRHFDVGDEDNTGQGALLSIAVQYRF